MPYQTYYKDNTDVPLSTSYVSYGFGFGADLITVVNASLTGNAVITLSYDGSQVEARLSAGESVVLSLPDGRTAVLLKYAGSSPPSYKLFAQVAGIGERKAVGIEYDQAASTTVTVVPSGTQDVNIVGASATVPVSAVSLPLPTNGSQESGGHLASLDAKDFATQTTLALIKAKTDNIDVALSTRTKPADTQVVGDGGGSITVDGTFFQATQPISAASLPLPTGASTAALQTQPGVDIGDVTVNNAAGVAAVNVQDGGNSLTVDGTIAVSNFPATQPVSAASLPLPTGAATSSLQTQPGVDIGDVTVNNGAAGAAVNIQDGGNSITVDGTIATTFDSAASASLSNVSASVSSVQLLASNASRKMATFFNDSASACYIKFGTTASTTSFTVRLTALSYYELPLPVYTGRIDAIWDTAVGAIRVTEL